MNDKDVTEECEFRPAKLESGLYNLDIVHDGNRIASIHLAMLKDYNAPYVRLWDINKGYDIEVNQWGNFKIIFNPDKNKICPTCGHKRN